LLVLEILKCGEGHLVDDEGRRIVVEWEFEVVVAEMGRAISEEGLQVISRTDHFWRDPISDFHRYVLLEAWSLELRLELRRYGVTPAFLVTTFSIYELAERETAIVATEPFPSAADWRREAPDLAAIVDRERDRIARLLERLEDAFRARTDRVAGRVKAHHG
jgi:hypothetical protein